MNKYSWLTRNLIVLSLVSLTQDAASELMYPLMPLFLTGVLAAPAIALGVVEGVAEVAAGLSKYWAGRASDRIGRKTFITTGYGLAGIGKMIVASSIVWPTVVFGRVVDRIGKGIRSAPRDALITTSLEPEHYGRGLGFHRSADTAGAVIGPFLALIGLAALNNDVRAVMWWAVIPAFLSMGLTFFVHEERTEITAATAVIEQLPLPRSFWTAALPFIAISLTNLPDTMLLLRLSQIGMSMTHVVFAYIAFNLVYTLSAYPAGVISDRLPRNMVYSIGLLAFSITYIALGKIDHPSNWIYTAVALYGFFPALTDGIGKAAIADSTHKSSHGRAQGVFQSLTGFAILVAGLWAGTLWNFGSGHGAFPMTTAGSIAGVAAVAMFIRTARSMRKRTGAVD